jgi:putative DNA-invertase from lambdoid prophage Rac
MGRDAIDVSTTVAKLEIIGVKVHCLALGGVDLTSSTGKLTMNVINSVAEFERDLLIERTQAGLKRAKAGGTILGRPPNLSAKETEEIVAALQDGTRLSASARKYNTSRQTIMRVRDRHIGVDELRTRVRKSTRINMANLANDNPD